MEHREVSTELPWIEVAPGAPYFRTERGESWTPVGQNDAVTWPELAGLFRRRDLPGVERHLAWLAASGVTCLRLMLEYSQGLHRFLEGPPGTFRPAMVRLWDDLFALCERHGLRILLTPFDTFWMWRRWGRHPYNRANGGVCRGRGRWLTCPDTRAAIKGRLAFATERWGGSGALFAWDLWNEIHPAHGGNDATCFAEFVDDVSGSLRRREIEIHGRAHPQTVSVFGPVILENPAVAETAFRHPALDFHTTHFYEHGTIDHPRNTIDAAISVGRLVREALAEVPAGRPFFDSEHGPIHTFKDHRRTLPEAFDDEYFRHIQWAHLAAGGAGGGMRWPNRNPHTLTAGMRAAQKALAGFLPLIDWTRFRRTNLDRAIDIETGGAACAACACGDAEQAIAWIVRTDRLDRSGMMRRDAEAGEPVCPGLRLPGLAAGRYRVTFWNTLEGRCEGCVEAGREPDGALHLRLPPLRTDLALAVRRVDARAAPS
jgi:mannan endo-1,4-beta-mannosidase